VSLRTIQRIESDGSASAESRLAIAAALGVPVENIHLSPEVGAVAPQSDSHRISSGTRWGYAGVLIGTVASAAGILSGGGDPQHTGTALGILGALAGIAAGAIGVLSQRARRLARDA
jgi:phage-related tail protein